MDLLTNCQKRCVLGVPEGHCFLLSVDHYGVVVAVYCGGAACELVDAVSQLGREAEER